ncbi:MAG: hypothetical protein JOZ57_17530 [Abitibacteriaceae bacterium]|nr:hypothetical protein [Abditibacteriaceae bacterium]
MLIHSSQGKTLSVLLLLSTILVSLPSHMPSPALAQPGVKARLGTPDVASARPFSAEEKATINKALALVQQENLCLLAVPLKVTNASLADIASQLQAGLPNKATIEVRKSSSARFTLDLTHTPVGQVLQPAATLTRCKLYVLSDRLLLAEENQLTESERAERVEWAKTPNGGGSAEPSAAFRARWVLLNTIATRLDNVPTPSEVKPQLTTAGVPIANPLHTVQLRFGDLNAELQQALQQCVNLDSNEIQQPPKQLLPDSLVTYAANPERIRFDLRVNAAGEADYIMGMSRVKPN